MMAKDGYSKFLWTLVTPDLNVFLYMKVIYSRFTASQTIGKANRAYVTSASETIKTGILNDTFRQRK